MSVEEPTPRMSAGRGRHPGDLADAPTTALPGPLNLAGSQDAGANGTTDVLSLDELFDGQSPPDASPTVDEAPTWTAMPVIPVRSEPLTPAGAAAPGGAQPAPLGGRVRTDAAAAWKGAVRRTRAWLVRDDHGLTLMTALIAVILILAVVALS
jgi:hypothetical protein